jgi:hypothetical protein
MEKEDLMEQNPEVEPESESEPIGDGPKPAPASEVAQDSHTFMRCTSCKHAENVNIAAGTFICAKHNMKCDAEDDAIPDDCVEYEE